VPPLIAHEFLASKSKKKNLFFGHACLNLLLNFDFLIFALFVSSSAKREAGHKMAAAVATGSVHFRQGCDWGI
jgi:hypothetical protein